MPKVYTLPPTSPVAVALQDHHGEKVTVTPIFGGKFPPAVAVATVADVVHIGSWREQVVRLQASGQGASVVSSWTLVGRQ